MVLIVIYYHFAAVLILTKLVRSKATIAFAVGVLCISLVVNTDGRSYGLHQGRYHRRVNYLFYRESVMFRFKGHWALYADVITGQNET